jgi:hypothetical protein
MRSLEQMDLVRVRYLVQVSEEMIETPKGVTYNSVGEFRWAECNAEAVTDTDFDGLGSTYYIEDHGVDWVFIDEPIPNNNHSN